MSWGKKLKSNCIHCFIDGFWNFIFLFNSLIQFLNGIQKYRHFGIIVYSNGIMYSMDNIEIENTLSIKQIFDFFPCSLKVKVIQIIGTLFQPNSLFFLKFRWTGSYQSYIWTIRNRGTLFFILFISSLFSLFSKRK